MDKHVPSGSADSARAASTGERAVEVVALYVDEPRQVHHLPESVSRIAIWLSILALVLGLALAAVSTGVLGSQIWHVKQQLDRQRRVKALVDELGLPHSFVPKVQSSNRWAIGGSTGLVGLPQARGAEPGVELPAGADASRAACRAGSEGGHRPFGLRNGRT